jgi:hypothetical protein
MEPTTSSPLPHDSQTNTLFWSDSFRALGRRVRQGLPVIVILGVLGVLLGGAFGWWEYCNVAPASSATVALSFPGFERGRYPDDSEFQAEDLRANSVLTEALSRQKLETTSLAVDQLRAALRVQGTTPLAVVAERDRVRAGGQRPYPYVPDEYTLTLVKTPQLPLDARAREGLLHAIFEVYRATFYRTHAELPVAFGQGFNAVATSDFPEFEFIFSTQIRNIVDFLREQAEQSGSFRSTTTSFSFNDLIEQAELFSQVHLNETLGLIYQSGLSRDRELALSKLSYHLKLLDFQEKHAKHEEQLIGDLLTMTQQRAQNPVLAVRSPTERNDGAVLDQGLIDSILANDSYSFLVRRALEAGLRTNGVHSERIRLLRLQENIRSFAENGGSDRAAALEQVQRSLGTLQGAFNELIEKIKKTYADYARQRLDGAVRLSSAPSTQSAFRPLFLAIAGGGTLGLLLGLGLALLGIAPQAKTQ